MDIPGLTASRPDGMIRADMRGGPAFVAHGRVWIRALAAILTLIPLPLWIAPAGTEGEEISGRESARECLQRALDQQRDGRIDEALSTLGACLKADPDSAEAHYLAGELLLERGVRSSESLEKAAAHLDRSLALAPGNDPARFLLAKIYSRRHPPGTYRPAEASKLYQELIAGSPGSLKLRLDYARWLADQEVRLPFPATPQRVSMHSAWTLELAKAQMEEVLKAAPPGTEPSKIAEGYIGEILMKLGRFDEARKTLEHVLSAYALPAPAKARALQKIGHCDWRQGKYAEAESAFRRAYELDHQDAYLWDMHLAADSLGGYPEDTPASMRFEMRPRPPSREEAGTLKLSDMAERLGVDRLAGAGPSAWADVDGDGREDLLLCGIDTYCSLYRNEGSHFEDITERAGLSRLESGFGAVFADYDNDGDMDFYVTRGGWNGPASNSLMRNRGDGTFEDVTEKAGANLKGSSFNAVWADFDRDGWLDLLVSQGVTGDGSGNRILHNNGDGTFTDVTAKCGIEEPVGMGTIGIAVGDYDGDGWPDIFVHGRFRPNRLWHNRGDGTFTDVAAQAGVAGSGEQNGYVAFFSDVDADGDLDIMTASLAGWDETIAGYRAGYVPKDAAAMIDTPHLWRNDGAGHFTDITREAGLVDPIGVMSGGMADLDNDGFPEALFGTGDPQFHRLEPNVLLRNIGGKRFVDVTAAAGFGSLWKGHGISFIDLDGDGDLDVFIELGGFYPGDYSRSAFYLNDQDEKNSWLSLTLSEPGPNRNAIGAGVTVHAGGYDAYQEVQAGEGFGSTSPATLHFGLGRRDAVTSLEVRWPDGSRKTYPPPPVDSRLRLRKGDDSWTVVTDRAAGKP